MLQALEQLIYKLAYSGENYLAYSGGDNLAYSDGQDTDHHHAGAGQDLQQHRDGDAAYIITEGHHSACGGAAWGHCEHPGGDVKVLCSFSADKGHDVEHCELPVV